MKLHRPDPHATTELPTGKPAHLFFDHPNHVGFDTADHEHAAKWHQGQAARHAASSPAAMDFHRAQATLHERAAKGQSNKIRAVPSAAVLANLDPKRRAFWEKESKKIMADNAALKPLEPYRMTHVLANGAAPKPNKFREKLNRSRSEVDFSEARHVAQDAEPPKPVLTPVSAEPEQEQTETEQASEEYAEIIRQMIHKRQAERHSGADAGERAERPSAAQRAEVRAVLDRIKGSRGGGW